jgi:hypothetical protein
VGFCGVILLTNNKKGGVWLIIIVSIARECLVVHIFLLRGESSLHVQHVRKLAGWLENIGR